MKLPKVDFDIIGPIIEEMNDPHWIDNMITRLIEEQPMLATYLAEHDDEEAALVGMMVFRFLESQCEADELKEMFEP